MKLALFYLFSVAAVTMAVLVPRFLKKGNDAFTTRMFYEIVKENPQQSVVLSAYSVLIPLAQLALASTYTTHDELLKAIGMPNDDVIKDEFKQAKRNFNPMVGVAFHTASKIYITYKYQINESFSLTARDVFNFDVENVDFSQGQKTASEINAWVEHETNKKIKDLVDPDSFDASNTRAVLVNSAYFSGPWVFPFNRNDTYDEVFHITKEKSVRIPMMHQTSYFLYAEVPELDAKILQLLYKGEDSSMILVLPNEIDGITQLEEKLRDRLVLDRAICTMYLTKVEVTIPKFKIETTTDLKHVLSKMNVTKLFDKEEASICQLTREYGDLFINVAIQKTFIEIFEEGSNGVADNDFDTKLPAYGSSLSSNIFFADRPFYFEIRLSDLTIFNGVKAE
ncbi:unnamed protein product [Pieris macdunnoughi]|uniref:Serpin domain-containing protein n=1 Tax=Pieris macdunnoughi TaxID=345717 RepID=A0A821MZX7_9NEOP|nr:unnamed protein product [Pieris macdunnoughi]